VGDCKLAVSLGAPRIQEAEEEASRPEGEHQFVGRNRPTNQETEKRETGAKFQPLFSAIYVQPASGNTTP